MKKSSIVQILILVVLIGLAAIPVSGWLLAQRALPDQEGIIAIPTLQKEVSLFLDERGIPSIEATSDVDVYAAQGWWVASERFFQMEMLRRAAKGGLSEIFGSGTLAQDKLMKQIGIQRVVKAQMKTLSPDVKAALQAYSDGVNAYMRLTRSKRQLEFWLLIDDPAPWAPEDSLCVMKYLEYLAGESWSMDDMRQRAVDKAGAKIASEIFEQGLYEGKESELKNAKAQLPVLDFSGAPDVVRGMAQGLPGVGSNAWVMSGKLSDTKGCLLALDRHNLFNDPNLWYVATLVTPGNKVSGMSIPGVPGIMFGRNDYICWGGTQLKADTQDLFIESFSQNIANKYKTPTGWAPVEEIIEEIGCRGPLGNKVFQQKVLLTRHGPVLTQSGDTAVVLAWSGHDNFKPTLEAYLKLNKARNWAEFQSALVDYKGEPQTFTYADKTGNIGMQVAGNIPVRNVSAFSHRLNAGQLLPGWTGDCDWISRLGQSELPSVFNPPNGYIIGKLDNLSGTTLDVTPYPQARVGGLIEASIHSIRRPGLPEMALFQADDYGALSKTVKDMLKDAVTKLENVDKTQLILLDKFEEWDGMLTSNSVCATAYEAFIRMAARRMLVPKIGEDLTNEYINKYPRWTHFLEAVLKRKDASWLPPEERTFDTFIVSTFGQAIKEIRVVTENEDPNAWTWGSLHQARFQCVVLNGLPEWQNQLGKFINIQPVPVPGDADALNACNVTYSTKGEYKCTVGPVQRLLIDMSDADKYYETQPLGQSGHLLSSNRLDQLKAWLSQKPLPVAFSEQQIDRYKHKLIFAREI